MTTLYKKDSRGDVRFWQISNSNNLIEIEYGTLGGESIYNSETIDYGLAGRTQQQQIELVVNSKINKKLDSGYVLNRADINSNYGMNKDGFARPMLAHKFTHLPSEYFIQPKLDGHRCLITNDCGDIFAYSRNGKRIDAIDHIVNDVVGLKDGQTIDGELYLHGESLQSISSYVKRKQEKTTLIKFIAYDFISDENYLSRSNSLSEIVNKSGDSILSIESTFVLGNISIQPILKQAIKDGYEGLIIRDNKTGYEIGKRSKSLLKVKSFIDDEFEVLSITSSKDGHAIFHMEYNGKPFKTISHGSHSDKKHHFDFKQLFIGRKVNVKYSCLTKDGIPFHPIATGWRDKDAE